MFLNNYSSKHRTHTVNVSVNRKVFSSCPMSKCQPDLPGTVEKKVSVTAPFCAKFYLFLCGIMTWVAVRRNQWVLSTSSLMDLVWYVSFSGDKFDDFFNYLVSLSVVCGCAHTTSIMYPSQVVQMMTAQSLYFAYWLTGRRLLALAFILWCTDKALGGVYARGSYTLQSDWSNF